MITVKISSSVPQWPLARQIPGGSDTWNGFRFCVNDDTRDCDYWVVLDDIVSSTTAQCNPENIILFAQEPPEIKNYPQKYLDQFATVITCHKEISHRRKVVYQQSLPWMIGVKFANHSYQPPVTKSYNELTSMAPPTKTKLISAIVSSKHQTRGHRQRLEFLQKLKSALGDKLDVYGSGFDHVPDKWDGIAPYKYHLVLENSSLDDYWTEKLTDAYLAYSYPVYWGCTNLDNYFHPNSFIPINIYKQSESIRAIVDVIDSDISSVKMEALKEARDKILNQYQLFPELVRLINSHIANTPKSDISESITLKNQASFRKSHFPTQAATIARYLRQLLTT